jgi:hypothetical protein
MSRLAKLHALAMPGLCACGERLPKSKGRKPRKVCDGCQASYMAIYGAARRAEEPLATLIKIRKLEKLAGRLVARAMRTMERAGLL